MEEIAHAILQKLRRDGPMSQQSLVMASPDNFEWRLKLESAINHLLSVGAISVSITGVLSVKR